MIPKGLVPLFWDADVETFDPQRYAAYTIGRVLELGDENAVAWMREAFPRETILGVLRSEHRLSVRSANFWALYFRIPPGEVASLRR